MIRLSRLIFVLLVGFLLGCQTEQANLTAVSTPIKPTPTAVETAAPPPQPTTLPPATSTAVPTSQPTTAPRPKVILSIPPDWEPTISPLIAQLNQSSAAWNWQLAPGGDADNQTANITLSNDANGVIVQRQPLALAVPFTTQWENMTLAQAQYILSNRHNLIVVLPWDALTPDWKALRVDGRFPTDADYPFHDSWSLAAEPGYETAVSELAPRLQAQLHESSVRITAVGDLMLARGLGIVMQQGNLAYPFANVSELLTAADLTIGNMESALGDIGQPEAKSYPFQAPPVAAQALAQAGFDIITLANNHAMDYGPEALLQGMALLRDAGIATIGAGANAAEAHTAHLVEVNGIKIAFLGYVNVPIEASAGFDTQSWTATETAPGLAWAKPDMIRADVTAVDQQTDLTIVVLHSGLEYVAEPSEPQTAAAQAAIDAGADLVIGHHAHILQGIQFYNGGVIVYGLGNFAFQITGDPETAVLNIWLDKNGVRQLELIPAIIQTSGQPRLAEPEESKTILQNVYFLTTLLNAQKGE